MKDLWGGRFKKELDKGLRRFSSSIRSDGLMCAFDVAGSIAHAEMLAACNIITKKEAGKLKKGLQSIADDVFLGKLKLDREAEDIHSFVEAELTRRIGPVAGKLHTARSRNDQVALDERLCLISGIIEINNLLNRCQTRLLDLAEEHIDVIMPGYTHLQRAQPVRLGHHLLAYMAMFDRDRERLDECLYRTGISPLGAGALAGTTLPISPNITADKVGMTEVAVNSMDAVSDRDYIIEFCADAAILMMHLSRLAEELVLWASTEFGFVTLADDVCTGSSLMPQKKNPDIAELVRGKTGRVYGDLVGILTIMKGLPLTYCRDMQEDKEALVDSVSTVLACLEAITRFLDGVTFNVERLREAAEDPMLLATDVAEYLVTLGVPFREAHELVGKAVRQVLESDRTLKDLSLNEWKAICPKIKSDIVEILDVEHSVEAHNSSGATSLHQLQDQIRFYREEMGIDDE